MTDSFIFDWHRPSDFWNQWNKKFKVEEMNGAGNFEIVLASHCSDNIDECLTSSGTIDTNNVTVLVYSTCGLLFDGEMIKLSTDVTFMAGDNTYSLKAIFLRNKVTGYVVGYTIALGSFDFSNQLTFDNGTILWSFS